uniref:Uncharacterized protein n=1 Tax=Leersia perrieri TaxID=77586 RepID=A0A0D9VL32_9ORYZ
MLLPVQGKCFLKSKTEMLESSTGALNINVRMFGGAMLQSLKNPLALLHAVPLALVSSYSIRRLRFLSTAAGFDADDYLVGTCGLNPAQARKASKFVSHLKSPSNPDAVRAFLAEIGLTKSSAATVIARHPQILCSRVDKTLTPRIAELREIGLSPTQISRLVAVTPAIFGNPKRVRRIEFYLSFLGSYDKLYAMLRRHIRLVSYDIDRVIKPNLAFLQQCNLTPDDLVKVFVLVPRLFCKPQSHVQAVVRRVEEKFGVCRDEPMFRHALVTAYYLRQETINAKVEVFKLLGWRGDQVAEVIAKMPTVLHNSAERLLRIMDFLTREAGMDVETIVKCPAMLRYSIEKRLAPQLNVLKLHKEEGLPGSTYNLQTVAAMSKARFAKKFVLPYKESLPAITDAYAAAL